MTPIAAPQPERSTWLARSAAGVSIAVHLAAVAVSLGYAGAGAYESAPEAVPVNLVTPEEVAQKTPEPPLDLPNLDLRPSLENSKTQLPADPPASSQPQARPEPAQQQKPATKQKTASAPPSPPQAAQPPAPQVQQQPAYTPPAPDISLQYGVDLGLKPISLAAAPGATPRSGDSDFDDAATHQADVDKTNISEFRAHLKQCAALPSQIAPDDKVVIVLRATFTPDAKLAAAPVLIEASASAKGPALMQAAIAALQNCQPHNSLPADKYAEWRVLDLRFTPLDFKKS